MPEFDNRGKISLWKPKSENPKAPSYSGTAVAHRDIQEGEELDIALWPNKSDNPKAPKVTGKLSDKRDSEIAQGEREPGGDDDSGDIPF